jgi:transposase
LAAVNAHRTDRLKKHLEQVGLLVGGRPGARYSTREGMPVSRQTVLRYVSAAECPEMPAPRVLGVDDWAIRKGQRYGTILYDVETHRPVDLLPDRRAESFAQWLLCHPGVEVISRDRAGVYAEGARLGAPNAIQVADRWHLAKNLGDALERFLSRRRAILKLALLTKGQDDAPASDRAWHPRESGTDLCAMNTAANKCTQTRPSRADREKQTRRLWRYGRYLQVRECFRQGISVAGIAELLSLDRKTVRKFVKAETFPERLPRPPLSSMLDSFKPDIRRLWNQGCRNAAAITRELNELGYTGGCTIVKDYVTTLRLAATLPSAAFVSPEPGSPEQISDLSPRCAASYAPRYIVALVLRRPTERNESDEAILKELGDSCEPFHRFLSLARAFLEMMRCPKGNGMKVGSAAFAAWLTEAVGCDVAEMRNFAKGLNSDRAAVEAAMALPWSNGPVEGAVQRLKTIKRQMYGRASFNLLRRRVLEPV